jgi:hypothetical protein
MVLVSAAAALQLDVKELPTSRGQQQQQADKELEWKAGDARNT